MIEMKEPVTIMRPLNDVESEICEDLLQNGVILKSSYHKTANNVEARNYTIKDEEGDIWNIVSNNYVWVYISFKG